MESMTFTERLIEAQGLCEFMNRNGFNSKVGEEISFSNWAEVLTNSNYEYSYGLTRVTITLPFWDFVVKIQIWDKETADYCANEEQIYNFAREENCGIYFAWCCKAFDYLFGSDEKSTSIYLMEKCDVDESTMESKVYDMYYPTVRQMFEEDNEGITDFDEFFDKYYYDCGDSDAMYDYSLHEWGSDEAYTLILCRYNVDDLHAGNFGWSADGLLKVTDYAGYGSDISSSWKR